MSSGRHPPTSEPCESLRYVAVMSLELIPLCTAAFIAADTLVYEMYELR